MLERKIGFRVGSRKIGKLLPPDSELTVPRPFGTKRPRFPAFETSVNAESGFDDVSSCPKWQKPPKRKSAKASALAVSRNPRSRVLAFAAIGKPKLRSSAFGARGSHPSTS